MLDKKEQRISLTISTFYLALHSETAVSETAVSKKTEDTAIIRFANKSSIFPNPFSQTRKTKL